MGGSADARVGSVLNDVCCLRTLAPTASGREVAQATEPRLLPQLASGFDRVDANLLPPRGLLAGPVQRTMMSTAQRDRELIADFAAEGAGLREA